MLQKLTYVGACSQLALGSSMSPAPPTSGAQSVTLSRLPEHCVQRSFIC